MKDKIIYFFAGVLVCVLIGLIHSDDFKEQHQQVMTDD